MESRTGTQLHSGPADPVVVHVGAIEGPARLALVLDLLLLLPR